MPAVAADAKLMAALVELAASATGAEPLAAAALELLVPALGAAGGALTLLRPKLLLGRVGTFDPPSSPRLSVPIRQGGRDIGAVELHAPAGAIIDGARVTRLVATLGPALALLAAAPPDDAQQLLELTALQDTAALVDALDLDAVLGRFLDLAVSVSHAVHGSVYLRDVSRKHYYLVRAHASENPPTELPLESIDPFLASGANHLDADPVELAALVPEVVAVTPALRAAIERGVRRILILPLRAEGRLMGILTLNFNSRDALAAATLPTLLALASHQAIAIENARAHRLEALRARLARHLSDVSEHALSASDEPTLWRLFIDAALALTRSDRGLVAHISGAEVTVVCGVGVDERLTGMAAPLSDPFITRALASTAPLAIEDTATLDQQTLFARVAAENKTRSFVILALRHRNEPIGVIFTGSGTSLRYEAEELEALQILGSLAAAALTRHRVQAAADQQRQQLAATIECLPIVVAIIARDGGILQMNEAARQFGRDFVPEADSGWQAGMAALKTHLPDGTPIAPEDRLVSRVFRGEVLPPAETVMVNRYGRRMHVLTSAAAIDYDAHGQVQTAVTAFLDVTALREVADEKDRFLRVASHELRSPITSLKATASLLQMDPSAISDSARREVLLARVQRQIDRLVVLVEQLIDSARVSAPAPLEPSDVDLAAVAADAVELALSGCGASPARVMLRAHGPLIGRWDRGRVEQVLCNLIGNALRYSPADSVVDLDLDGSEHEARIAVRDHGIGVPDDVVNRVFRPFFRAPNAVALHKEGLGLGMHITAEIVARHRGQITVEATPGGGATFVVVLPRRALP